MAAPKDDAVSVGDVSGGVGVGVGVSGGVSDGGVGGGVRVGSVPIDVNTENQKNKERDRVFSLSSLALSSSPSLCSSPLLSGMKIPDTDVYRVVLSGGPCSGKTRFV